MYKTRAILAVWLYSDARNILTIDANFARRQKRDGLIEHVKVKTLAFKNCNVACRFSIADFHQSMKDGIVKFDESKQKVC